MAKTVFIADDGQEFDTLEEVRAHEEMASARKELATALDRVNKLLAGRFKTADGEPFTLPGYYWVVEESGWLVSINHIIVRPEDYLADRDNGTILRYERETSRVGDRYWRNEISIGSLYKHERNAMVARYERLRRIAAAWQEDADNAGKRLGISNAPV